MRLRSNAAPRCMLCGHPLTFQAHSRNLEPFCSQRCAARWAVQEATVGNAMRRCTQCGAESCAGHTVGTAPPVDLTLEHVVEPVWQAPSGWWIARCVCGWSKRCPGRVEASLSARGHRMGAEKQRKRLLRRMNV